MENGRKMQGQWSERGRMCGREVRLVTVLWWHSPAQHLVQWWWASLGCECGLYLHHLGGCQVCGLAGGHRGGGGGTVGGLLIPHGGAEDY